MRLIHAEQTAGFLYNILLTADGIGYRLQRTPPRCSALVFADACDIVFAH
jgi:hypothetical protein